MKSEVAAVTPPGPFAPGDMCGAFEISQEHARGGMAIIYAATDPAGERRAIKVLQPGKAFTREQQRRFWIEIEVLRAIVSPYIVRFHAAAQHEGIVWVATDFLEGDTLKAVIARQRAGACLSGDDILHLALQIARGLCALQTHQVIHRDLKPGNIILANGIATLVDFGIAKYARCFTTTAADSLTLNGTLAYMSPEQVAGSTLDARTDIFNFGLIIYELITGRHPLGIDDVYTRGDVMARVMKCDVAPLTNECDPRLAAIVHRSLARNPENRFSSASQLEQALAAVISGRREEARTDTEEVSPASRAPAQSGARLKHHLRLVDTEVDAEASPPALRGGTQLLAQASPISTPTLQIPSATATATLPFTPPSDRAHEPHTSAPRTKRARQPRTAVSRTLFNSVHRTSRLWQLVAVLVAAVALIAVPAAWYFGRESRVNAVRPMIMAERLHASLTIAEPSVPPSASPAVAEPNPANSAVAEPSPTNSAVAEPAASGKRAQPGRQPSRRRRRSHNNNGNHRDHGF